jgi:hypothetical protein
LQDEGKRNFHVLKSVKGCTEVKVLDVQAHVLSTLCAEDTVPHQFGCGEVGGACGELAWIVD